MYLYFIGICGTAMGNGALLMRAMGHEVAGSDDNIYPPMSTLLEEQGVAMFAGYVPEHLEKAPDLVVIGNAMSRGNREVEEVLARRIPFISLAQLLGEQLIRGKHSVVVSGTHGK